MKTVILDATPLDTGHRTRGIGRYVQGLICGFKELHASGDLDICLKLLRVSEDGDTAPDDDGPFRAVPYKRTQRSAAARMHLENRLRLDRVLPPGASLYHATGMEGYSRRTPWVATCHDLIPLLLGRAYLPRWALARRAFWRMYLTALKTSAARIIAISEHTRATLTDRFGVRPDRVDVVYHGLSPWFSEPADVPTVTDRIRTATDRPFVLFVGGFDPRKNFPLLVDALWQMPAADRPRLLVAGQRSLVHRSAHGRLRRLRRLRHVFLEFVSDVDLRFLYHRARCLAFPSHEEGWGFPIVEGMAAGAPVVCADFGSMAEAAGGAALTADVTRADALADALSRLCASDSLRLDRIRAGRSRVKTLRWQECARRVVDSYRAVDTNYALK